MKIIKLDLSGCNYLDEIHERIRTSFGFPEWYGKNWDAFWDLLWSECDADCVEITGERTLSSDFNVEIKIMHEVLDDNVKFRRENNLLPFHYKILD